MDLSNVRAKLQTQNFAHYQNFDDFVADCRLIFENCAIFNEVSARMNARSVLLRSLSCTCTIILLKVWLNKKNKLNCRTDAHKLHTFNKRKMWDLWPNTAGFTSFRLAPIYRNCKFLILNQTGHTAQSIFRAALKAEEIKQVSLTLGKWQISAQSFAVCRRKRKALSWMWHALCSIGPQQARIGSL